MRLHIPVGQHTNNKIPLGERVVYTFPGVTWAANRALTKLLRSRKLPVTRDAFLQKNLPTSIVFDSFITLAYVSLRQHPGSTQKCCYIAIFVRLYTNATHAGNGVTREGQATDFVDRKYYAVTIDSQPRRRNLLAPLTGSRAVINEEEEKYEYTFINFQRM